MIQPGLPGSSPEPRNIFYGSLIVVTVSAFLTIGLFELTGREIDWITLLITSLCNSFIWAFFDWALSKLPRD